MTVHCDTVADAASTKFNGPLYILGTSTLSSMDGIRNLSALCFMEEILEHLHRESSFISGDIETNDAASKMLTSRL